MVPLHQVLQNRDGRSLRLLVALFSGTLVIGLVGSNAWVAWGQDALSDETTAPESLQASPEGSSTASQRTLLDTVRAGGWIGLLIGLCSVVAVAFIIEHSITIRKEALMPGELCESLEELVHQGRLEEAAQLCRDPTWNSLVAHVVLAGLARYQASEFGFAEYRAAVEEAGEEETARLYRKTEVLGVIGAVTPMLGLTGTVLGMIKAFNKIAATGGMARPEELADGISQALVTTLMGLLVAIPAMIAFSYFRNRIDSLVAEAGKRVEQILMPLGRARRPV